MEQSLRGEGRSWPASGPADLVPFPDAARARSGRGARGPMRR